MIRGNPSLQTASVYGFYIRIHPQRYLISYRTNNAMTF